jgi:hypothetical protein
VRSGNYFEPPDTTKNEKGRKMKIDLRQFQTEALEASALISPALEVERPLRLNESSSRAQSDIEAILSDMMAILEMIADAFINGSKEKSQRRVSSRKIRPTDASTSSTQEDAARWSAC